MEKSDLERILIETARLSDSHTLMVVGSQSLYGVLDELPNVAYLSNEVDILLETEDRINIVDERLGEHSAFYERNFCYAHVLEKNASMPFPVDWKERAIKKEIMMNDEKVQCLFMSPEDLCVSKLAVGRKKDLEFVFDLIAGGIVETPRLRERIEKLPEEYQKSDAEYMLRKIISLERTPSFGFGDGFDL